MCIALFDCCLCCVCDVLLHMCVICFVFACGAKHPSWGWTVLLTEGGNQGVVGNIGKNHSFFDIQAVCTTNKIPGGADPESMVISASDASSDIYSFEHF